MMTWILLCVLFPALSAAVAFGVDKKVPRLQSGWVLLSTAAVLAGTLLLALCHADGTTVAFAGLSFTVDGFRGIYAVVTAFMWFCAALLSPRYFKGHHHLGRYYFFFLLTLGATVGVFLSADLITTFVFFEIMSFASYVWVVQEQNKEAMSAGKTYLAIAVMGGMVLLMGLFLLHSITGTLVIRELSAALSAVQKTPRLYIAAFCMLFGFGAKAGLFPLHIWLPRAHPVAPAPASALLSGVLTKTGVFGMLLISANILTEDAVWGYTLLVLGTITMVLGAVIAVFSTNLKRTLACSSLSQIGFITVGVSMLVLLGEENALAANGTVLYMLNHSLVKLVLFLCAGAIYAGAHTLDLNRLRGYGRNKPLIAIPFFLGAASLAGIPGMLGYVSKTLVHESIVEYAHHGGALITAVEWLFLFSGGLTAAYMLKLFITIFVQKPTALTPDGGKKMDALSVTALLLSAVALPVAGVLPHGLAEKVSGAMLSFVGGHESHHAVHYFAFVNLKGVLISLGIGAAVYLIVIRRLLTKRQEDTRVHYNPFEGIFSLENNVYKPLLRAVLFLLGAACAFLHRAVDTIIGGLLAVLTLLCRFFGDITDLFVWIAKRTVLRPAKDIHEPHPRRFAYALGCLYGRLSKKDAAHTGEAFVRGMETIAKTTRRLTGNFSFALLMTCFGICIILVIILFVGAK